MIRLFLVTAIVAAIGVGCQGVRRIDMRNATRDSVYVIWKLEKDSLKDNPFLISNSEELRFGISPQHPEIKMSFGRGGWSLKEVQKLSGFLKSLEIISPNRHVKIDSLPLLQEYLLARRKGVGGGTIEIVVAE